METFVRNFLVLGRYEAGTEYDQVRGFCSIYASYFLYVFR